MTLTIFACCCCHPEFLIVGASQYLGMPQWPERIQYAYFRDVARQMWSHRTPPAMYLSSYLSNYWTNGLLWSCQWPSSLGRPCYHWFISQATIWVHRCCYRHAFYHLSSCHGTPSGYGRLPQTVAQPHQRCHSQWAQRTRGLRAYASIRYWHGRTDLFLYE